MTKDEKAVIIDELKDKLSSHNAFYIIDAGGMSVASINDFRRLCFNKGLEYKVYKNTLIKKAMDALGLEYQAFLDGKVLKNTSGIIFSQEVANLPARTLKEFRDKGNDKPVFKGASIENALFVGHDNLENLVKLKSKIEMLGELAGMLQSPGQRLASALQSAGSKLAGALQTLADKDSE